MPSPSCSTAGGGGALEFNIFDFICNKMSQHPLVSSASSDFFLSLLKQVLRLVYRICIISTPPNVPAAATENPSSLHPCNSLASCCIAPRATGSIPPSIHLAPGWDVCTSLALFSLASEIVVLHLLLRQPPSETRRWHSLCEAPLPLLQAPFSRLFCFLLPVPLCLGNMMVVSK